MSSRNVAQRCVSWGTLTGDFAATAGSEPRRRSVQENHVGGHDQLILPGTEVVGRRVIGMLVSELGPEQAGVLAPDIEPMTPSDRMCAVARLRAGSLSFDVVKILVPQHEIIGL